MGDHLVLFVDRLVTPATLVSIQVTDSLESSGESSRQNGTVPQSSSISSGYSEDDKNVEVRYVCHEEEPLGPTIECRICQEDDNIKNLEIPCACSGSLKFAHRRCVQRWCNEKGDITCEICLQPYKPSYTTPLTRPLSDDTIIDVSSGLSCSGGWAILGSPLHLHDHRLLEMAATEHHFLEAEYDEYAATNASGAAFCQSTTLILMALLLLRHALTVANPDGDDDASTFFSLFVMRATEFLLPCYIMAWAISILLHRRQRQEATAMATAELALLLQSVQRRGLQFPLAVGLVAAPRQELL